MRRMRAGALALAMMTTAVVTACGGRQVDVQSGAAPAAEAAVNFTNNTTQAANVYVLAPSGEIFLRQVAPNTTESLPVRSVPTGTSVRLEARLADGSRTYTSNSMTLSTSTAWRIP